MVGQAGVLNAPHLDTAAADAARAAHALIASGANTLRARARAFGRANPVGCSAGAGPARTTRFARLAPLACFADATAHAAVGGFWLRRCRRATARRATAESGARARLVRFWPAAFAAGASLGGDERSSCRRARSRDQQTQANERLHPRSVAPGQGCVQPESGTGSRRKKRRFLE